MRLPRRSSGLNVYNRIEISSKALLANAEFFRTRTGLQIIPVIKSNAYGHGLEQVAEVLDGGKFPFLAVDGYFEALKIRKITSRPVLVMGMIKPEDFKNIRTKNISFFVQDEATIRAIGSLNRKVKVHLEINTGMNRYGISPSELDKYLRLLKNYPKIEMEGVLTHLADPDTRSEKNTLEATAIFDDCVRRILAEGFKPEFIHIGQSASCVSLKSKYANTTRIGLSLYGINPFAPGHKFYSDYQNNLKPVLKLVSSISKINTLKPGDKVGYNYTFTASKPMRIAVLPLGYYEGVKWSLSNKGMVKYKDKFLPIAGKVCMNHTMIDLKDSRCKAGDEITVISNEAKDPNSFNSIAQNHGLFVYELPVSLSPEIRRVLV